MTQPPPPSNKFTIQVVTKLIPALPDQLEVKATSKAQTAAANNSCWNSSISCHALAVAEGIRKTMAVMAAKMVAVSSKRPQSLHITSMDLLLLQQEDSCIITLQVGSFQDI